jgi:hypothetical protein
MVKMNKKNYSQGKYKPIHPEKYKGDVTNIIYRSSWERKFLYYCDMNEKVLEYSSEEFFIPYKAPDGKIRRYFPDFLIKVEESTGVTKKYLIEIKPKKQTVPPPKPKRQTKKYISEVYTYVKNQSKWEAAREWCLDRGYEFRIFTETELNIKR